MGASASVSTDAAAVVALKAALAGRIEPVRVTVWYRVALLIVGVAISLLPPAYLSVVALSVWGVYVHATENTWLLDGGIGLYRATTHAYVAPLVAGVVVIFFLFKPLLARSTRRSSAVEIAPGEHPHLVMLVRGVARAVGAPVPTRIAVDCEVNASASFQPGLRGFLRQDLQLTIGLPLITGLTLTQLAGVLAHEMGHFAQGSAMRLTLLVRLTNAWLARVVYQRDEWDHKLAAWSRAGGPLVVVALISRLAVWISRGVLWVLMMTGHAISTAMLRQMEFDADRYGVRLVGSSVFVETAVQMRVLAVASQQATATLATSYAERRLADDFPALVAETAAALPVGLRRQLEDHSVFTSKPGVFDAHPPDAARIERALREQTGGIFRLSGPGPVLAHDLGPVTRRATEIFYRAEHDIDVSSASLVPIQEILERESAIGREEAARGRYFGLLVSPGRPLAFRSTLPPPPARQEDVVEALREARATLERLATSTKTHTEKMLVAHTEFLQARGASELLAAAFRPKAVIGVDIADATTAESKRTRALKDRNAAEEGLAPGRAALHERLSTALSMLGSAQVLAKMTDVEARVRQAEVILSTLEKLAGLADEITRMVEEHAVAGMLLSAQPADEEEGQRLNTHAYALLGPLHVAIGRLIATLDQTPYPFEHARVTLSLAVFLADDMPAYVNELSIFARVGHVLSRLYTFHSRALGRLALLAEEVEAAVGVESESA